jgi:inosine triphosphate pyrophosphatase
MSNLTFVTGNQDKADYLARYLGVPVSHAKLDLDEIQSLNLHTIVEHKIRQAYTQVQAPVIVEDVSLEFVALGGLPGPFIKFFRERMTDEELCRLVDGKSREVIARCVIGYFNGVTLQLFEGSLPGTIPVSPAGDNGFGWDRIFVPQGYNVTRAALSEADNQLTYTTIKPFAALKAFLDMRH